METITFKERVTDFWTRFEQREEELRKLIDEKAGNEELLDVFQKLLDIAFDEVYFNLGFNSAEQKHELILTPEGNARRYYATWYWLQLVPESLKEKWNFYASKPAMNSEGGFGFQMHGKKIDADDLTIYVEKDTERDKINLEIYSEPLSQLEDNQKYSMFFIFLDLYISELYTMNYIGYVDFIEDKKEGEVIPLSALKEYIEQFMAEKELTMSDVPNRTFSVYKLNIEEPECLREDVFVGNSTSLNLINDYYKEENEEVDTAEKNGIVWGFVFYNNSKIPQDEMISFRSEIEDLYINILEEHKMGLHIGSATGNTYSYMDFVIFDLPAFLNLTNQIAEKYDLKNCGFSTFKKDGQVTVFAD